MLQLPPDSHWATPDQSCGAADAGAASTPMPIAAAPARTVPPRRTRLRAGVVERCLDMGDPPITACEVSCRVRANRCPAACPWAGRLHPEARVRAGDGSPAPVLGWLDVRLRRTGFGGPVPRARPGRPGRPIDARC